MANRTANYASFYVKEPFSESNLGAFATPDFLYFSQLRQWKGKDSSFPFVDAHVKTYSVRDDSQWDTLKSRLHERLSASKNIVLFLSNNTKASRALTEEIDYGINVKGLPVIVVYPGFKDNSDVCCETGIRTQVKRMWDKFPAFRDSMEKVATLHVPYSRSFITRALLNPDFMVQTMAEPGQYYYPLS